MKKNTGKVLSLVLAFAMVVTSFSSTFVSASTQEVAGNGLRVDTRDNDSGFDSTIGDDEYHLVSDKYEDLVIIDSLEDAYEYTLMDREDPDEVEYVSFSKKSGDSLVKVKDVGEDDDEQHQLILKKNVSGTEVINITYKATYTDDDTDKEVTARGSIEVTLTVGEQGSVVLGMDTGATVENDEPDEIETAAVNDSGISYALYLADHAAGTPEAVYKNVTADAYSMELTSSSQKVFVLDEGEDPDALNDLDFVLSKTDKEGKVDSSEDAADAEWAKVATTKLQVYGPKVTITRNADADSTVSWEKASKGEKVTATIGVGKKYRLEDADSYTIDKVGGKTVIGTWLTPDASDKWSEQKDGVKIISGYEIVGDGSLTINGGSLGDIDITGNVTIDGASVGNVKLANGDFTIADGSAGELKIKGAGAKISIDDGASVDSIHKDSKNAALSMDGGTVNGDVRVNDASISDNDDYKAVIKGTLKANTFDISGEDAGTSIATIMPMTDGEDVNLSGDALTVGTIDADYREANIYYEDFNGSMALANAYDATIELVNSKVAYSGYAYVSSIDVDEDSTLTLEQAKVSDISGDGTIAIPADKLYVTGDISDVKLMITEGLATGAIAFRANSDAVDADNFNQVGYTLSQQAVNSDVDKFVIDSISFAGLSFDKSTVEVAKGYTDTVTVNAYPNGTAFPADAKVAWQLDGNDDYITYTVSGNTATISVKDYNTSYPEDNKATLTATLVDADGYELEGYVVASCNIVGLEVPKTTVTLDTKEVTKSVGEIYQFIAKSSDGSAVTAESSDISVATVALYDANDSRGYKFQINAVGVGTSTITVKNQFGASAAMTITVAESTGTLRLDTTSYTMAPGDIYDFRVTTTGTTATPVVTDSRTGSIVTLTDLGDGKYRITGRNAGECYIVATVGNTRVSLKVTVQEGVQASGVKGNNVSVIG